MKIFRNNTALLDAPISDRATERKELMVEHAVSLDFELAEYAKLQKEDYIVYNNQKFYLNKDYIPEINKSTNGYKYDLKFYDITERFKDFKLKYSLQGLDELDFTLTASGDKFLDIVIYSLAKHGLGAFVKGQFPTAVKEIQFQNVDIFSGLNLIAETYELEWWLDNLTINTGRHEYGTETVLEYDKELDELTFNSSSEKLITRLYPFGSTRNIPFTYRTGQGAVDNIAERRLRLPAGTDYVDLFPNLPANQIIEDVKIFEEIYPRQKNKIVEITTVVYPKSNDTQQDTTAFIIKGDNAFTITENELMPGQPLKIAFDTGNLQYREFELIPKGNNTFEIKYEQQGNVYTPNPTLCPKVGDEFFFFNIKADVVLPAIIPAAEQELLVKSKEFMSKLGSDVVFDAKTRSIYCENSNIDLQTGQKVLLKSPTVGEVHSRIRGYEKNLYNKYECTYTVGGSPQYSRLGAIEKKSEEKEREIKKAIVEKTKETERYSERQWRDARETMTMLQSHFDNFSGGINPVTINTMQMLAGDESSQFRFVNSKTNPVQVSHAFNYSKASRQLSTDAGIIQHLTLGIMSISTAHAVSEYKFWDVGAFTSGVLDLTSQAYYLYAKCSKTTRTGSFVLSENVKKLNDDVDFYHLLVGVLNSENGYGDRSFAPLWGYTEILPGRITTNKIVSSDGNTYFDLLNGIIGGKIRFLSGSTGLENIPEFVNVQAEAGRVAAGRNLLRNSNAGITREQDANKVYLIKRYDSGAAMNSGEYTVVYKAQFIPKTEGAWFSPHFGYQNSIGDREYGAFDGVRVASGVNHTNQQSVNFYQGEKENDAHLGSYVRIDWVCLYEGVVKPPLTWIESQEDVQARITSEREYVNSIKTNLQYQIDGNISSFFYDYEPAMNKPPSKDWTTVEVREMHLGDLFYYTSRGYCYRFQKVGGVFSWTRITDTDVTKALADAAKAQDTADGKRTTFIRQPDRAYQAGDLWLLAEDWNEFKAGEILTAMQDSNTFTASHWQKRVRYTDDTAVRNLQLSAVNLASVKYMVDNFSFIERYDLSTGWFEFMPDNAHQQTTVSPKDLFGIVYLPDTQYTIAGYAFSQGINEGGIVTVHYTDGSFAYAMSAAADRLQKQVYLSDAGKTIARIVFTYYSNTRSEFKLSVKKTANDPEWSVSPDDVRYAIIDARAAALAAVDSLKNFTDDAFRDGIADMSERESLKIYLKGVEDGRSKITASYAALIANVHLTGEGKSNLTAAYGTLETATGTLIAVMTNNSADGTITDSERGQMDEAVSAYRLAASAYETCVEAAYKAIQTYMLNYVNNLQVGGVNLIRNGNFFSHLRDWHLNYAEGQLRPEVERFIGGSEVPSGVASVLKVTIRGVMQGIFQNFTDAAHRLKLHEPYTLSFIAKTECSGVLLYFGHESNGGSATVALGENWQRFRHTFTPAEHRNVVFYGNTECDFLISNIQLEAGVLCTAYRNDAYIEAAIAGSTEINGGLVLGSVLGVRGGEGTVTAGMSGLTNAVQGKNVRFWAGETIENMDKAPFRVYEDAQVVIENTNKSNTMSLSADALVPLQDIISQSEFNPAFENEDLDGYNVDQGGTLAISPITASMHYTLDRSFTVTAHPDAGLAKRWVEVSVYGIFQCSGLEADDMPEELRAAFVKYYGEGNVSFFAENDVEIDEWLNERVLPTRHYVHVKISRVGGDEAVVFEEWICSRLSGRGFEHVFSRSCRFYADNGAVYRVSMTAHAEKSTKSPEKLMSNSPDIGGWRCLLAVTAAESWSVNPNIVSRKIHISPHGISYVKDRDNYFYLSADNNDNFILQGKGGLRWTSPDGRHGLEITNGGVRRLANGVWGVL